MIPILQILTGESSHPPAVTPTVYAILGVLVLVAIAMTRLYYHHSFYQHFWKGLQYLQVLALYTWYLLAHFDLTEALPFYHCRLATLAILFLPQGRLKTYFAYLGTAGSICALLYPVFDPYPFPHVTILSYVFGHVALLINSLTYLYRHQEWRHLSFQKVLIMTFVMNLLIGVIDLMLGANYGFLRETPLLAGKNGVVNVLLVTLVIAILIMIVQKLIAKDSRRYSQSRT